MVGTIRVLNIITIPAFSDLMMQSKPFSKMLPRQVLPQPTYRVPTFLNMFFQHIFSFITARKHSLRRLCFYTCLSFILFTGGSTWAGTPPDQVHPPGTRPPGPRYPPDQVHPPGLSTPPTPRTKYAPWTKYTPQN